MHKILVKGPRTYFMKIHLVFLELYADVYNEESVHILKDFVKRSKKQKSSWTEYSEILFLPN